jgi:predicted 3-demethylubiquinone-9 3-methyltransferase (glyoxalase superfamily)
MDGTIPCLWFDSQGEDAASFSVSAFASSGLAPARGYGKGGAAGAGRRITRSRRP